MRVTSSRPEPGDRVEVVIEDEGGINLTGLFDFRSILFLISDEQGIERYREDLTGEFVYDEGSYTRGVVRTVLPNLPGGRYVLTVRATDNFNNRGEGSMGIDLREAAGRGLLSRLFGLPNPFAEFTEIVCELREEGPVRVSVYSVSGRRVREFGLSGHRGENRILWDGRDARGGAVANGVYLVRVSMKSSEGEASLVEPLVRIR
jgi:hypothetical protein